MRENQITLIFIFKNTSYQAEKCYPNSLKGESNPFKSTHPGTKNADM